MQRYTESERMLFFESLVGTAILMVPLVLTLYVLPEHALYVWTFLPAGILLVAFLLVLLNLSMEHSGHHGHRRQSGHGHQLPRS